MNKKQKIKMILDLILEIERGSDSIGGFSELDQTEIEFLHNELLDHVTHEGLDKYIKMLESCKEQCY